jgi:tRNA pseudouridine38-40 synthase
MPARLKLIVAYDGTEFAGWQSQLHRNTIQDHLERAVGRIAGIKTRVHGAGRTDAGVHALAQCAHVDLPDKRMPASRWLSAINALLPPTIRVSRCQYVSPKFHARFSAKGKVYRYRIWAAPILPPLELNRVWHVTAELDLKTLKNAASRFVGEHDFTAFAANRGKPDENAVRKIHSIRVRRAGSCVVIEFDGDGFLYKMVRLMTGAIVRCAMQKMRSPEIDAQLKRGRAQPLRCLAPAGGLFLVRIRY